MYNVYLKEIFKYVIVFFCDIYDVILRRNN